MSDDRADRLLKIAYLHLFEKKSLLEVREILSLRGATELEAETAILSAKKHLDELRAYRNFELLKGLGGGAVVVVLGLWLAPLAEDAPGRFQGMPLTIILLGLAVMAYAIWARFQPR